MIFDPITAASVTETARTMTITLLKKRELNLAYGSTGGKSVYYQTYYNDIFFKKHYSKKYWPYQYMVNSDVKIREVERWCWDRFKGRYWSSHNRQYVFKREKDAVLFALKWM